MENEVWQKSVEMMKSEDAEMRELGKRLFIGGDPTNEEVEKLQEALNTIWNTDTNRTARRFALMMRVNKIIIDILMEMDKVDCWKQILNVKNRVYGGRG